MSRSKPKIKFAMLGIAGFVAKRHLQAIKDVNGILIAAFDPHDSVGLVDSYFPDCQFFTEYERFDRFCSKQITNNNHIDYISICSPNYLHDAHCRFALRIGADAICEKPLVLKERNLDELKILEEQTGKRVYSILQLRLHKGLIDIRKKIKTKTFQRTFKNYKISKLKYKITRGDWYRYSWKYDTEKSGGVATNIGIHLFDMISWIFDGKTSCRIDIHTKDDVVGAIYLNNYPRHSLQFELSIKKGNIPIRQLEIGNINFEFSDGFTDLHTESYRQILVGKGFGIEDIRPAIRLCEEIRNQTKKW